MWGSPKMPSSSSLPTQANLSILYPPPVFLPISHLSFSFLSTLNPLHFSSLSLSKPPLSLPPPSFSISFHHQDLDSESAQEDGDDYEEDEPTVGDCLVFEEGAFEDPYLQTTTTTAAAADQLPAATEPPRRSKKPKPVKAENLIPDEWRESQEQLNLTKKQKRAIAQQMQRGRRVEKKPKPPTLPTLADYTACRDFRMSQLSPVVLDDPPPLRDEAPSGSDAEDGSDWDCSSSGGRVAPRNPRERIADGSLEDIVRFFNSGDYAPPTENADASPGRRKLFTKEEKVLLNKRIPNLMDATSDKWLPLHTLVASGEFYLVDMLLKHNVNINATDRDGLTALHRAILSKKQAVTNYLLRESANPFVRDIEGATLMHYAVLAASSPAIKILLLYNVDINLPDDDGWTPLHLAVQTQRTDIVRLLLIKGADRTLKNRDGLTPLDLCLYSGHSVRTYELIKMLRKPSMS